MIVMTDSKILQAILDKQTLIIEDLKGLERKFDSGFKKLDGQLTRLEKRLERLGRKHFVN